MDSHRTANGGRRAIYMNDGYIRALIGVLDETEKPQTTGLTNGLMFFVSVRYA